MNSQGGCLRRTASMGLHTRRARQVGCCVTAACLLLACFVHVASAQAAPTATLSVFIQEGSAPSPGEGSHLFDTQSSDVSYTGNATSITVTGQDPANSENDLQFEFGVGQTGVPELVPGEYPALLNQPDAPSMAFEYGSEECSGLGGFDVKDYHVGSNGQVDRAWIVFELHCGDLPDGMFGEIRIGEPPVSSSLSASPAVVRWPAVENGGFDQSVPVTFTPAGAGASVTGAEVTGADASSFPIESDGCADRQLTTNETCQIEVGFNPQTVGALSAKLLVSTTDGGTTAIDLQGLMHGGSTQMVLDSQPGDFIGNGQDWEFDPGQGDEIRGEGYPNEAAVGFSGIFGVFVVPQGQTLSVGETYTDVGYWPFDPTEPSMSVTGFGRGCNSISNSQFTIGNLSFYPDGLLHSVGATFVQYCDGNTGALTTAALTGTLQFRVGDDTPQTLYEPLPTVTTTTSSTTSTSVSTTSTSVTSETATDTASPSSTSSSSSTAVSPTTSTASSVVTSTSPALVGSVTTQVTTTSSSPEDLSTSSTASTTTSTVSASSSEPSRTSAHGPTPHPGLTATHRLRTYLVAAQRSLASGLELATTLLRTPPTAANAAIALRQLSRWRGLLAAAARTASALPAPTGLTSWQHEWVTAAHESDGAAAVLMAAVTDVQKHHSALARAATLRAASMLRSSESLQQRADQKLAIA